MKPAFKDGMFFLDDHPLPLLSGEMHYWRLDPHSWQSIMQRVQDMDVKIVSSYVCWDFHEVRTWNL